MTFMKPTSVALSLLVAGLVIGDLTVAAKERTVQKEDSLPIYLHPAALAETEKPSVELAASGGGFWIPGPERFHGWALRDLRNYLQRMTGAQFPLMRLEKETKRGIFAGTFADFADFQPAGSHAQQAFASTDPEAFLVEVQRDNLFILGRSKAGVIAGIYTLLDRLGCKWLAPGEVWENVPQFGGLTLSEK